MIMAVFSLFFFLEQSRHFHKARKARRRRPSLLLALQTMPPATTRWTPDKGKIYPRVTLRLTHPQSLQYYSN